MRTKDKPDGRLRPTFTEAARRAQIIECATQTIATLGYAQTSLAQIALRAGISKGVITYYFASKEELLEQVVEGALTAAADFLRPQIIAAPTTRAKVQTYLHASVMYMAAHRLQMLAITEIALNLRTADGALRYQLFTEPSVLEPLEALLRQGQDQGEFRAFDPRVMALSIRGAIDAAARFLVAHPHLDGEAYAQEVVMLFDLATRKE